MGGYGAIYICQLYPEKFNAACALSPANISVDLIDWKYTTPIIEKLLGKKTAQNSAALAWNDILDTQDLIFSKENPLIPSIKRDSDGKIVDFSKEAFNNWEKYNLNNLIRKQPNNLKEINLLINCEEHDQLNLSQESNKLHNTLTNLGITHEFEIYTDKSAEKIDPHSLGQAYKLLEGINFCLQHFSK